MAINPWPSWLQEIYPNWLERIQCPTSGVGDLDDLRLSVGVGENGRWVGFVNTGWYYHANREQFNYVVPGNLDASLPPGSSSIISADSFRPSWGPILVNGVPDDSDESNDGPYIRHHNSLQPGITLSWTQVASGMMYQASIPAGALLVGLRNLTNLQLGSVAGSGDLSGTRLYWLDEDNDLIYVLSESEPVEIFADFLYVNPILLMRELVVQEASGVLPSYKYIEEVTAIRGYQSEVLVTGSTHSSGYLTHTLTGVSDGDWVVLEYYIRKSFIVQDHQTLELYSNWNLMDQIQVSYETSTPDTLPSTNLADGTLLDFNPSFSGAKRAGYLYHTVLSSPATSYMLPVTLLARADKSEVCGEWGELIKVSALLLDRNDLPIPGYPISLVLSAGASGILTQPDDGTTDGRGEVHALIGPPSGSGTLTATFTVSGITPVDIDVTLLTPTLMIPELEFRGGFVSLVDTGLRTSRGMRSLALGASTLDGIPRKIEGGSPATVVSKNGNAFLWNNTLYSHELNIIAQQTEINPHALVKSLSCTDEVGDQLFANSARGHSRVVDLEEDGL